MPNIELCGHTLQGVKTKVPLSHKDRQAKNVAVDYKGNGRHIDLISGVNFLLINVVVQH